MQTPWALTHLDWVREQGTYMLSSMAANSIDF